MPSRHSTHVRTAGPSSSCCLLGGCHAGSGRAPRRAGLTIVEIIAVVGIIAVLVAILVPALSSARGNAAWATSQSNLRQAWTLIQGYVSDNRETLVPSQFDYSGARVRGKVRAPGPGPDDFPPIGLPNRGTWADIVWTAAGLGPLVLAAPIEEGSTYDYRADSPDRLAYALGGGDIKNVLRSAVPMKRPFGLELGQTSGLEATPFGQGAGELELNQPGYFAMNDFFDSRAGRWWTPTQIRLPSESVYVVDSRAGETIAPTADPWRGNDLARCQVDFRYPGSTCIMLFVDGHVDTQAKWKTIEELQGPFFTDNPPANADFGRNLRISNLDRSDNPQ
ncbi:MAG: type II secretion system protein [Phycisphaerales bacterium]|nr:type II secretion system protein [Phycisphaerales bacterium]